MTLTGESTGPNDARIAESERLNGAGVDQSLLEHFGRDTRELRYRCGIHSNSRSSKRASSPSRSAAKPCRPRCSRLPFLPQLVVRGRRNAVPCGRERAPLAVEPVERRLVEAVPAELVDDEDSAWRKQPGDLVEPCVEIADVVEGVAGDDRVELLGLLEVVELQPAEVVALRRERVDPEHVVPCDGERGRQLALPAADVEHPCRRRRQVLARELQERRLRHMPEITVSTTAVRRLAVAAQAYTGRYRRATTASVEATIRSLSCVQLDSISTVERSHRIALTARAGDYPREAVSHLLAKGRIFEYWAHEACLLPIESWPIFRRAMKNGGRDWYSNVNDVKTAHPQLAKRSWRASARKARSRHGSSRGLPAAACGTGSRRKRCSSGSGTTVSS